MHSHSLMRLSSRIYNVPHLITPDAFTVVLDYLDQRNADSYVRLDMQEVSGPAQAAEKRYADGLGVLRVDGSLTYKPVTTMCGEVGTSYRSLVEQVHDMADHGVRTIVMEVSSGGGQAAHCFETASEIRSIADEHNIVLIGYADELACSAAYALISVCDQVVANPSATIGSIGCVVALLDTSVAMKQAGLKRIFVTSGESKVPFAADGSFKQEFLDDIQADVDRLNSEFAEHVSAHTGISKKTIMGFEAKVFDAQTAVKKGLADAVMSRSLFATYVAQVHKGIS